MLSATFPPPLMIQLQFGWRSATLWRENRLQGVCVQIYIDSFVLKLRHNFFCKISNLENVFLLNLIPSDVMFHSIHPSGVTGSRGDRAKAG